MSKKNVTFVFGLAVSLFAANASAALSCELTESGKVILRQNLEVHDENNVVVETTTIVNFGANSDSCNAIVAEELSSAAGVYSCEQASGEAVLRKTSAVREDGVNSEETATLLNFAQDAAGCERVAAILN